ncbi:potassium channel family protein [Desulforudis sp. 1088]|uniref:potassium channel family protein n=1 Tax=unclassified Candidatus Desulforudis TaxID=2635950 RepID=UPI00346D43BA
MKQFAVIGLGRFGTGLAVTLARMGYEVLAVDRDEDRVKAVMDEVTHAVQADALDAEALKALGLKSFDVVVVAIGTDIEASILTTVMLKEMKVRRIVAKANTELHGKVLARVGADKVIFPERDMGVRVAHAMVSGNILDHIELSPDYSVVELVAPEGLIGKTLGEAEIRGRHGISLIAIRRGADVIVAPGADQVIEEGDILVAIGKTKRFDKWGR